MLFWITGIFLWGYALLFFRYRKEWKALGDYEARPSGETIFLSVVIPARNEEERIGALLTSLQHQTYPQHAFEILVVDDYSTDQTADVVNRFHLPHLRLLRPLVPAARSSKKKSIEAAIQQARGELIVATDADCVAPPRWLETIAAFYTETAASFIAAPVRFTHNGSGLQLFQALDFLTLQGITAASVAAHFHSMCNGANLAYTKKAFEEVRGFEGIDQVSSGDDMLLMYKIWKRHPQKVFYLKSREAIMGTRPMETLGDFIRQRKRWGSKTLFYDDHRVLWVLVFVYLLNLMFFVWLGAGFFHPVYWWGLLGFVLLKTGIEWPFVASVARFYGEGRLMKYFPFFQPFHLFYTVVVGVLSQLGHYEWKGRRTK